MSKAGSKTDGLQDVQKWAERAFWVFCGIGALVALVIFASFCLAVYKLLWEAGVAAEGRGLLMAYIVVSVGFMVALLTLLLRVAERVRYPERDLRQPSLTSSLVIVALGVALGVAAVIVG